MANTENTQHAAPALMGRFGASLTVLGLLAVGILGTWWLAARADQAMRRELLTQTRAVARALSLDRIRSLSGTPEDLTNPNYLRLKEALTRTWSANERYRFLYLMGRRADGEVVFLVDNEPEESRDYSAPGDVFEEASGTLRSLFDSGDGSVEGPVSDKWGTWVTALVPIKHTLDGRVLAVFGMDVDADVWAWEVAARTAPPTCLLLLVLFSVAALGVSYSKPSLSPKPITHRLLPPLAVMVVLTVFGTGAIVWKQEHQRMLSDVRNELSTLSKEFGIRVSRQSSALRAILTTYAKDVHVQRFLGGSRSTHTLAGWHSEFVGIHREFAVQELTFLDSAGVPLFAASAPGKLCDASKSVAVQTALKTRGAASGLEVGLRGVLLLRVVMPVYLKGRLVGYVQIGKDMKDLLQNMHADPRISVVLAADKKRIDRNAWESMAASTGLPTHWQQMSNSVVIYSSPQDSIPDPLARWADHVSQRTDPRDSTDGISANGADWRVSSLPLRDAAQSRVGDLLLVRDVAQDNAAFVRMLSLVAPAAGVLTVVLLGFVYVLVRGDDKAIRIQQAELLQSKEHLSATLHSIGDGVISADAEGLVTGVNLAAERLAGWSRDDAIGRPVRDIFQAVDSQTQEDVADTIATVMRDDIILAPSGHCTLTTRSGAKREIAGSFAPIHNGSGAVIGVVVVFHDNSEERRVQRLAQTRLTLLEYSGSHSLDELLSKALDEIAGLVESPIGFYHFVDPDQNTLTLGQWSSLTLRDYCHLVGRGSHYPVEQAGVWADAVREKRPMIHNDYESLPNKKGLPPGHAQVTRELVVPVIRDARVLAVLGVGNKPADYTQQDLETVSYLADVTWEIVNRKRAEMALTLSEERFRSLFDQSRDAILLLSAEDWKLISANPAAVKLFAAQGCTF